MLRNNKGVTLVEVIVVVALLSLVLILITSVNIFGHKQLAQQSSQIENQSNAREAINLITKEIRRASTVEELKDGISIDGIKYIFEDHSIKKNNTILISNIDDLEIIITDGDTETEGRTKINIKITSKEGKNQQSVTLSTTLYLRE
ncbi:prepilin-type N-terminal cleavage/methylation domain-containing protein [Ferdinandcohnia quinoae]|uniref:Prepilin-type N-terminal cleavage/methylation domain-containing protein n=1 Tax=Fredinandcohnia quinoae TaxID=2918902 RepID=A0AAW5E1V0_9BACI|nr:prepilin-type N-terminal cleavage/methylation domain-containing protein [Fredinandcohnia sp. SECRCQ15]MCH1626588.1 prepilin-type N-terminal cleavage/methylation domain-containing protein [Fredinandcohnia sp. SECRCQ15]